MRVAVLLMAAAGILLAAPALPERTTITDPDGLEQSFYRADAGSDAYQAPPARTLPPPRFPSDTGILWVDRNHRASVLRSLGISGDGQHILASWEMNASRTGYYRTMAGEVAIWEYPGNCCWDDNGQQLGVSEDGSVLAISSRDDCLKWSRNSPVPDWSLHYPSHAFGLAGGSYDGSVVAATQNGTLYAFDAASGDTLWTAGVGNPSDLHGITLSDDGSVIAVTLFDSCLVFDSTGARRAAIPIGTGSKFGVALSGDASMLVIGSRAGHARLYRWNGTSYDLCWSAAVGTPWVAGVGISRDGSTIACGTGPHNSKLCVFDSSSATPLWSYQDYGSSNCRVTSVALSEDGSRIVAASWGDVAGSGTFKVFTAHDRSSSTPLIAVTRDEEPGSMFACDISDDGQFAVCGGKAVHATTPGNGGSVYAFVIGSGPTDNVGIRSIESPSQYVQVDTAVTPQATAGNFGDSTASFYTHVNVENSAGTLLHHDSVFVNDLEPGQSRAIAFADWAPPAYDSIYTFTFHTALPGDEYPGDDSLATDARCFHDARATGISSPLPENTIYRTVTPQVSVRNNGSYTESMFCQLEIRDSLGNPVYADSGQTATIAPDASTTISFTDWTPINVGPYTAAASARAPDDYHPENDSVNKAFTVTWEIVYDDGSANAYYRVGRGDNDKFYVRFTPTLTPPFTITRGRVFFHQANAPFDYVMVCGDSSGRPDTNNVLARIDSLQSPQPDAWVEFNLDITLTTTDDIWLVTHWFDDLLDLHVGADASGPRDYRSYFSSNQDTLWLWTRHDWMMRLTQTPDVGVETPAAENKLRLRLLPPAPNPFSRRVSLNYEVPLATEVQLKLFDATGRQVACLADGLHQPGRYERTWQTPDRNPTTGVLFAKLVLPETGESRVRKLVLLH